MPNISEAEAVFTKKSGTSIDSFEGPSASSDGSSKSSAKADDAKSVVNGKETNWADNAGSISKLAEGCANTISLNGNYTFPTNVMKAVADKNIKATFVIDSVKSWVIDLTLIPPRSSRQAFLPKPRVFSSRWQVLIFLFALQ